MSIKLHKYIADFEQQQMRPVTSFRVGDMVVVQQRIREANKQRTQTLKGYVIARENRGLGSSFRLLGAGKIAGLEVKIPLFSPDLLGIEVMSAHHVRQAKLYYMRELTGKAFRLKKAKA
jgi:large subunit ribosomal protein L19